MDRMPNSRVALCGGLVCLATLVFGPAPGEAAQVWSQDRTIEHNVFTHLELVDNSGQLMLVGYGQRSGCRVNIRRVISGDGSWSQGQRCDVGGMIGDIRVVGTLSVYNWRRAGNDVSFNLALDGKAIDEVVWGDGATLGNIRATWSVSGSLSPPPTPTVSSGSFVRIQNRWKPDQHLHVEHGGLVSGPIRPGWTSAQWTFEPVPGTQYVRIRNRWKSNEYIHIQFGGATSGRIENGWTSAEWIIEPIQGTEFVRIRNRWQPQQYLHVEHGQLASGPIQPGWWSAQWVIR